jgi:hypothetical protein
VKAANKTGTYETMDECMAAIAFAEKVIAYLRQDAHLLYPKHSGPHFLLNARRAQLEAALAPPPKLPDDATPPPAGARSKKPKHA